MAAEKPRGGARGSGVVDCERHTAESGETFLDDEDGARSRGGDAPGGAAQQKALDVTESSRTHEDEVRFQSACLLDNGRGQGAVSQYSMEGGAGTGRRLS